ncbi:hypothetical protein BH10PLA2_BH10PLA2_07410 [soil metagenome]
MSTKKDPSGHRSIQVEVEVPGTPEDVWQAIATGPGISSWFVPTTSEQREGGQMVANFGPGMDFPAKITSWEALKRFATEGATGGPGSPMMATEWSIEARAGGKCLVRVVHSLFASTDDWDNQLDGLEQGWPPIFRILHRYLESFKGQTSSMAQFMSFSKESDTETWEKFGGELGLLKVSPGQKWSTPAGAPSMSGVVDALGEGMHSNTVLIRLDTPAPGTAYLGVFKCGGMTQVYLAI